MCGGGHPSPRGQDHPVIIRGGFRGWTPGSGPGRGKITGRPAIDLEANPMCILTSGGDRGGSPQATANWYRQQQRKGGWLFDRAGRLLARFGAHPLGEVVAGRLTWREWARFELTPSAHETTCRYRRACARVGWA